MDQRQPASDPQRGAPEAITSVMRGESQLFFLGVNIAAELHNTGKIRAIAVSTSKRSPALPDVPTVAEAGLPEYQYDAWFAVMAPAGTTNLLECPGSRTSRLAYMPGSSFSSAFGTSA